MKWYKNLKTDIFKSLYEKVPSNIKTCFISGMIIGWITHFYMLTHKLPNWDDISQINNLGLTSEIGRWLLRPLQNIAQRASNPAIHGMVLILFLSLASCMIVAALEIESVTASILVPAIMLTFPSVTGIMYFMFTAHLYGIGVFLFASSAYFIHRFRYGFLPAGICIVLGLGVYQPFVSIAISLFLIALIIEVLKGQSFLRLVKSGFIYAGTLALSTVIYVIISNLVCQDMDKYGGVNDMGHIPLAEIPRNFARVYKRVLEYFIVKPFAYVTKIMHALNILTCIVIVLLLIFCLIRLDYKKRKLEIAFAFLMAFLLPFAMGFVYFMAPKAPFSTLMLYAYSILYVFALTLAEFAFNKYGTGLKELAPKSKMIVWIFTMAVTLIISLISYNNYLLDAQAYFRTSIAFERATNYYNRILTRVEETSGYAPGDRIVILGNFYYKDNPSPIEIPLFYDDDGYRELDGVALENGLITSGVRNNFIGTYMGFKAGIVSDDEKEFIEDSTEYKAMSIYPKEGSIVKINDVWVVKLCE